MNRTPGRDVLFPPFSTWTQGVGPVESIELRDRLRVYLAVPESYLECGLP